MLCLGLLNLFSGEEVVNVEGAVQRSELEIGYKNQLSFEVFTLRLLGFSGSAWAFLLQLVCYVASGPVRCVCAVSITGFYTF